MLFLASLRHATAAPVGYQRIPSPEFPDVKAELEVKDSLLFLVPPVHQEIVRLVGEHGRSHTPLEMKAEIETFPTSGLEGLPTPGCDSKSACICPWLCAANLSCE